MICGIGPLAVALNWNQMRAPVRSYPLSAFGTSTTRRYQTASVGAALPDFISGQLLSSRLGDSPCARSPEWNLHCSAGRLSKLERSSMTFCDSREDVTAI